MRSSEKQKKNTEFNEKLVGNAFSGGSCYSYRPCRAVNFLCHSQTKHTEITDRNEVKQTNPKKRTVVGHTHHNRKKRISVHKILYTVKPILEMTRRHGESMTVKESDESERKREKRHGHRKTRM